MLLVNVFQSVDIIVAADIKLIRNQLILHVHQKHLWCQQNVKPVYVDLSIMLKGNLFGYCKHNKKLDPSSND